MMTDTQPEGGDQKKNLRDLLIERTEALDIHELVQDAGDKMRSLKTDSLPVADDQHLVGTVMDRNADRKAAGQGHDPQTERVGACMSHELIFCYEDQHRAEAELLMKEKHLKYLPIVDRDMRIVGIVTQEDLAASKGAQSAAQLPNGTAS
jgi:CBS domain-containing protein